MSCLQLMGMPRTTHNHRRQLLCSYFSFVRSFALFFLFLGGEVAKVFKASDSGYVRNYLKLLCQSVSTRMKKNLNLWYMCTEGFDVKTVQNGWDGNEADDDVFTAPNETFENSNLAGKTLMHSLQRQRKQFPVHSAESQHTQTHTHPNFSTCIQTKHVANIHMLTLIGTVQ